jgi:hypothetical protein
MNLTVGLILKLAGSLDQVLTANGILDATGAFVTPVSATAIAKATADYEVSLKASGLVIPEKVDQIVQVLPALLVIAGVK